MQPTFPFHLEYLSCLWILVIRYHNIASNFVKSLLAQSSDPSSLNHLVPLFAWMYILISHLIFHFHSFFSDIFLRTGNRKCVPMLSYSSIKKRRRPAEKRSASSWKHLHSLLLYYMNPSTVNVTFGKNHETARNTVFAF